MHTFKKGAAILATELDLPIVPVAIDGLYKVWPRKSWRIRPAKVKITIGKPFYAAEVVSRGSGVLSKTAVATASKADFPGQALRPDTQDSGLRTYEVVTDHLRTTIAAMIDECSSNLGPGTPRSTMAFLLAILGDTVILI